MKNVLRLLFVAVLLCAHTVQAKEIAVFMPVVGPLTPFEQAALSKDAVTVFSARFDLRYGEEVDQFVKQVFQEESKKKDCDEASCYRRIAAKYQADKIVALRVIQVEKERYLATAHLYDVASGDMLASEQQECMHCSFERLKQLCHELTLRVAGNK
jgi:hypothetical protein